MFRVALESLDLRGDYAFVVREDHRSRYGLDAILAAACADYARAAPTIVGVPAATTGPADSVARALRTMRGKDLARPCLVAAGDRVFDGWHAPTFLEFVARRRAEAAVATFRGSDPRWTFVEVVPDGNAITRIADTVPISGRASAGLWYFASTTALLRSIERMMADESKRFRGEWRLTPAVAELIAQGKHVIEYPVPRVHPLSTPDELRAFEALVADGSIRLR
jgi:dTDP-glucose pyrophosphorylase